MRIVPAILTNVAVAGVAILVYDTVRSGDAAQPAGGSARDSAAFEARFAAIETRLDGLASVRGDRSVAARLAEIETRIAAAGPGAQGTQPGAASATSDAGTSDSATGAAAASAGDGAASIAADPPAPVTDAEVARFRRLQERADAERERERIVAALDGVLARLGLNLTPDQRARLGTETVAFRSKLREVFPGGGPGSGGAGGVPGGGRPPEEAFAAMQELQRGYVARLEEFLPRTDAVAIASALAPGGRGPGRGGQGDR